MAESVVETNVTKRFIERGWLARKLKWIGRVGAPDRLFAKGGRTIFVEFKKPGETPAPHQVREHARMKAAGIEVYVVDSTEAGYRLVEEVS